MKKVFQTEVGLLALWNSESFSDIDSKEKYQAHFVNDKDILDLMNEGKVIAWGTGGDGSFPITIRVNPEQDLTDEERIFEEMSVHDLKLVVTSGRVLVGTPEGVGNIENKLLQNKEISLVEEITPGKYLVDIYYLYDTEAMNMEWTDLEKKLIENPDFDRSGYIVVIKSVDSNYDFPTITELPHLG